MSSIQFSAFVNYKDIMQAIIKADNLISGQREALELIKNDEPLFNVLLKLVTMFENQYSGVYCSILILNEKENSFKCGVNTKTTHNFSLEETGVSILPPYMGPCCMAMNLGQVVVVSDLENDDRWQSPWRDWSISQKLKSCRSQPIISSKGKVLGTFAMYHKVLEDPAEDKLYQLEMATLIAGIAIEKKLNRDEEIEQREYQLKVNKDLINDIKVRDEFLSIATHELKTPLTILKLQNELKRKKFEMQDEISKESVLELINNYDKQLSKIVNNIETMFDVETLNHGKLKLIKRKFNLTELIKHTIENFRNQIESLGGEIDFNLPNTLEVYWDQYRIEQVLNNLISNAIKYAPGTKLIIEVSILSRDNVCINICDGGKGIEEELIGKIFDRYKRGNDNSVKGLGLGLYVVREIVNAHSGQINVQSEIGVGTKFSLQIPHGL